MVALIILFATAYVAVVAVCQRVERNRQWREQLIVTEQDRARARVLLHRSARERQLAQLEHDMQRGADEQLWQWERGQWESWS